MFREYGEKMIELTREEIIVLLRNMSVIEGFLWSYQDKAKDLVWEGYLDPVVELLTDKLKED
jgi:hypothetical protein